MKITKCKACMNKIVFLKTAKGRVMPVDADSLLPVDKRNLKENIPVQFDAKRGHISHFATCPAAARFRDKSSSSSFSEKKEKQARIKNTITGKYISSALQYIEAEKNVKIMNENAGEEKYEVAYE